MKFLKTIRFDPSDSFTFERAAEPDEWAVSGAFAFSGADKNTLAGKNKQEFSNGFLSLKSFGHSTFTSVANITGEQYETLLDKLTGHFISHYGAPSQEAASAAARDELAFIADLCNDVSINSVFTVSRHFDDSGEICEEFRIVDPPGGVIHNRAWEIVDE